jgi:hypothetical protein
MTKFIDDYVFNTGLGCFYQFQIKDNLSEFGTAPVMKSCKNEAAILNFNAGNHYL